MYDGGKIIFGIIIFVIIFTSPIWINMMSSGNLIAVNLVLPENAKECVMDKDYMKNNHMDLLNQWRDLVVRKNIRYLTKDGEPFYIDGIRAELSLTKTCMNCHSDRKNFCDQCHNYMDVNPYCWDCHVDKYTPETGNIINKEIQPSIEGAGFQARNNMETIEEAGK